MFTYVTFYYAVSKIYVVIIPANQYPYTAKFVFVGARRRSVMS